MAIQPDVLTLPDEMLIPRIIGGEKHLFEVFMRKYNQRLYRVGMAILHDDQEVEDIMQTAYIKAYENLKRFEGKSSFLTWLTRILINEGLMRLKKRKNHEPIDEKIHELRVETRHPMNVAMNNELKEMLEGAIAQLPPKYRMVFMMREIEGMNVAETTECLEISEANVKVRLNRAKEMLREKLSHYVQDKDLYSFHLKRCEVIRNNVMSVINRM